MQRLVGKTVTLVRIMHIHIYHSSVGASWGGQGVMAVGIQRERKTKIRQERWAVKYHELKSLINSASHS